MRDAPKRWRQSPESAILRRMRWLLLSLSLAGCATQGAVGRARHVDPDAAKECVAHCGTLGMELTAVVIIMDSTGCVCEPAGRAPTVSHGAAAATGGAAIQAVVLAAQAQQQQAAAQRPKP
jgi:hypothetical protein